MDLEVREAKLVGELVRGLHSIDGQDLSAKLEELNARMAGDEDERTAEAGKLSKSAVEISNTLVNLGMMPIPHIPSSQSWLKRSWWWLASS
jgi:hypothetical protein